MGGVARPVAIALGSNLGDRHARLSSAIERLGEVLTGLRVSSFLETDPVDTPDPQEKYLNAAAVGHSPLGARALLDELLVIEAEHERERPYHHAPRTLDLDLILCGGDVIDEPGLVVPHPRFRERLFVLAPLAEIAPELRDPVTGLNVGELLARARVASERRLPG